ncbi:serine/threonine-protein kinase [Catelliglobosispora koreensis]|uniref:serine/threonine-protein kinase n=1 Tax=Catelliglobosispora koreensis TaxID=129052 RepID=UPI00037CEB65|nr:serine/threonine-protein kinase [Catelliglobosispora koreensis]
MSAFTPAMKLGDRYHLQERIGTGGMAEVWRALDTVLGRTVAIKALDGRLAADASLRESARQEARAAARLSHPNITAIHDFAEHVLADGRVVPYLVLELLAGETLAQRLAKGPLPWAEASAVLTQIGSALAAAHAHGVVHQDIKPSNIMLTPSGAKILDFGIAAIRGRDSTPGWTSGTPAYAAPERLRTVPPHPAADVYSLGVVAFEMATGSLPWEISTWEDAREVHDGRTESPVPQGIPASTAGLVQQALSADPAARPMATAFGKSLAAPGASEESTATLTPTLVHRVSGPIAASAKVPVRPTTLAPTPAPPPLRRPRRSPGLAAAFAVIVLLLTLGAVFLSAALLQSNADSNGKAPVTQTPIVTKSPTPSPTSKGDSVVQVLSSLRQVIATAVATGQLEDERGEELSDRADDLVKRWQEGKTRDFIKRVEDLRKDIDDKADDGEISRPVAIALDQLLKELIERAKKSS